MMSSQKNKAHKPLRLQAKDPHDLKILSALLQDALIHTAGMHYSPEEQQFTVMANRFCWESEPEAEGYTSMHQRTRSALHFSHVKRVRQTGIDRSHAHQFHNLLTVHADKEGEIHLLFSDNTKICLYVDQILCCLTDLNDHWWTHQQPKHEQLLAKS